MLATIRSFLRNERGATAIEYGLIVAVLSLAIVGGVGTAANAIQDLWGDNNGKLQQAFQ